MTSSSPIDPGKSYHATQPEHSEFESGSETQGLSSTVESSLGISSSSPLTRSSPMPTALSAHVEGDSSSLTTPHSSEPVKPFHLGVREKETSPFHRFLADDGTWHVLSIRMKTKNGTFLVPQTEEQWEKAAQKMMGLKDKHSELDFKRGLTVDFTHQSFIFTDANQRQQAFVYSRHPNLKSYISTMQSEVGANMGITVKEKDSVRSLKKRGIRVYNEVSRLEKIAESASKTISWAGNLFTKKQPTPPAPPLPPPSSSPPAPLPSPKPSSSESESGSE